MTWAALTLLLLAAMVGSAPAGVAVAMLAACCAMAACINGSRRVRVAALLILVASLALSLTLLPEAKMDMDNYRTHASTGNATTGTKGAQ